MGEVVEVGEEVEFLNQGENDMWERWESGRGVRVRRAERVGEFGIQHTYL